MPRNFRYIRAVSFPTSANYFYLKSPDYLMCFSAYSDTITYETHLEIPVPEPSFLRQTLNNPAHQRGFSNRAL